jgi:hypothetical protein
VSVDEGMLVVGVDVVVVLVVGVVLLVVVLVVVVLLVGVVELVVVLVVVVHCAFASTVRWSNSADTRAFSAAEAFCTDCSTSRARPSWVFASVQSCCATAVDRALRSVSIAVALCAVNRPLRLPQATSVALVSPSASARLR